MSKKMSMNGDTTPSIPNKLILNSTQFGSFESTYGFLYNWYAAANSGITNLNGDIYGGLYNWYAVDTGKLAPAGWHVPSNNEIIALMQTIEPGATNISNNIGIKIKETGWDRWIQDLGAEGTDDYGLKFIPSGIRDPSWGLGEFWGIGIAAFMWSSTESGALWGYYMYIANAWNGCNYSFQRFKKSGYAVR